MRFWATCIKNYIPIFNLYLLKKEIWFVFIFFVAKNENKFILNKYFLVSFVSTFLSVAIALQGLDMVRDMQRLREAQSKKQEILREIAYWEGVTRQYDDYRDGYFRLALLEYQLGNREQAKTYIQKALEIDPNFEAGIDFQRQIGG